jgi:hypothetical protein
VLTYLHLGMRWLQLQADYQPRPQNLKHGLIPPFLPDLYGQIYILRTTTNVMQRPKETKIRKITNVCIYCHSDTQLLKHCIFNCHLPNISAVPDYHHVDFTTYMKRMPRCSCKIYLLMAKDGRNK